MITPRQAQASVIALLKADAALVAVVAAEIREAEWQGTAFVYPACRVDESDLRPQGTGGCAEDWTALTGAIRVFSKEESSGQCLDLLGLVQTAIQRRHLIGLGYTSLEIKVDMTVLPYQEESIWRGEVTFYTTLIPT